MMTMRYANINEVDTVNGQGVAVSIFFQGCSHHCKGCFNVETWDFNGGYKFTDDVRDYFIKACQKPYINCVSILGGEPFDQPDFLLSILTDVHKHVNKPVYVWSGYLYEDLLIKYEHILKLIDYLIDGEFVENKKDLTLKLRGSSNQRIIDLKLKNSKR